MANFATDLSTTAYTYTGTLYATSTGVSTDANAQGTTVNLTETVANGITCWLVVGNAAGTSPTLNVKMQESTNGSSWSDIGGGAFTQVTTSSQVQAIFVKPTTNTVRCTGTVGGTNPVFEATVLVGSARRHAPADVGGFNQTAASG